jgi:hypothetical protein
VERAADHGKPVQALPADLVLLGVQNRVLERRVGKLHHVRARVGAEIEAPREVGVKDVEASRPEPQLNRLNVDHDVVTENDGPRQPGIGHAGASVDLEAHEPLEPLGHRRDAATLQAKHCVRARRAPA